MEIINFAAFFSLLPRDSAIKISYWRSIFQSLSASANFLCVSFLGFITEHLERKAFLAVAIRLSLAEWLEARDEMFLLALQQLYIILPNTELEVYTHLSGKYTCK